MNSVILMGRLTRDPDIRYGGNDKNTCIARIDLAVDRRFNRDVTDFFKCTAFGKTGEFCEKYLRKGQKVVLQGEIQNDNYKDKEGRMVYGTNIIIQNIEFAESKKAESTEPVKDDGYFMDISDVEEDGIPFN